MTGYALSFEEFTFVPEFAGTPNYISDKKVVWNFGDGTLSNDLTATHAYNYPGLYPITLTIFLSTGDGTQSSVLSTIQVQNFVNDYILITCDNTPIQISGQDTNKFYVTRYNSSKTSLSGKNTILVLSVSGNKSPFFTAEEYETNKYAHLYSTARFAVSTNLGLVTVNELSTTNDVLYASPAGSSITLSTSANDFSVVAGSSGTGLFYYIEDYNT